MTARLARPAGGLLAWLLALLVFAAAAAGAADFLQPDEAFRPSARFISDADGQAVVARYRIAGEYYMYRDQFKFAVDAPASLGAPVFPPAKIKFDATFNKDMAVYRDAVEIRVPVRVAGETVRFTAVSQGCADAGLCYSPQEARFDLRLGEGGGWFDLGSFASFADFSDDPAHLAATLQGGRLGTVLVLFFGLGLLLSFTPCVLPMVPILSSLIVGHASSGQHGAASRTRGLLLSGSYTLGMALVYTALGVAAGLAGEGLAGFLQTPWLLGISALVMVLFALSMFDVYTLQLPLALQTALSQRFAHLKGGHYAGVFGMGALSALIVGPCMAAPLAGALIYISQTRDTLLGGTALFALAIGMGTPLLLIGASAGALVPRAGRWMEAVKRFFGVLMIAVAIWLVSPVLPPVAQALAWAGLSIGCAFLLGLFSKPASPGRPWTARVLGALFLMGGVVLAAGAVRGAMNGGAPWSLDALRTAPAAVAEEREVGSAPPPVFERVRSVAELDAILAKPGKPVMVDFYADWCVSCKEMERFTYTDPRVAEHFAGMRLLQVDVTANTPEDRALLKRFALFGPPGILFFGRDGRLIEDATVIGYQNADRFLNKLQRAATL